MLRKTIPAAIALLVMPVAAHAADISAPAGYDWTGFYIGAHGGGLFQGGDLNLAGSGDNPPDKAIDPSLDGSAFFGGVLAGFNYQMGAAVIGVEGDIGFGNAESTVSSGKAGVPRDVWRGENKFSQTVNGHVRAKLGYAMGSMLIFGAAGLALSNGDLDVDGYCFGDKYHTSTSQDMAGWTVGGGLEYAATDHLLLRAEYLYDDYGDQNLDLNGGPPNYWQDRKVDLYTQTIRAAISYKF